MSERRAIVLPTPSLGRPLVFGGLAALVGAAVWGALRLYAGLESGWLAWGIGGLVGFAVVRGGGYGSLLAGCAGVLALLAIVSGKNLAYRIDLDRYVDSFDEADHGIQKSAAADWVALGDEPTDAQVLEFTASFGYEVSDVAEFRRELGSQLRDFHETQPDLEQWRQIMYEASLVEVSFLDYLAADFHPLDLLFLACSLGTAFALVSRRTTQLIVDAHERRRRERDEQAALERHQRELASAESAAESADEAAS